PLPAAAVPGADRQLKALPVGVEDGALHVEVHHRGRLGDDPHRAPGAAVGEGRHQLAGEVAGFGVAHLGAHHLIVAGLVDTRVEGDDPDVEELALGDRRRFLRQGREGGGFDLGGAAAGEGGEHEQDQERGESGEHCIGHGGQLPFLYLRYSSQSFSLRAGSFSAMAASRIWRATMSSSLPSTRSGGTVPSPLPRPGRPELPLGMAATVSCCSPLPSSPSPVSSPEPPRPPRPPASVRSPSSNKGPPAPPAPSPLPSLSPSAPLGSVPPLPAMAPGSRSAMAAAAARSPRIMPSNTAREASSWPS